MARLFDDAATQYLEYAAAILTAVPLTITCWFRSDDTAASQDLVAISSSSAATNYFRLNLGGNAAGDPVRAIAAGGSNAIAATSTGYSGNTWHHAAAVFSANDARAAYIDGGSKGTNATAQTPGSLNVSSIGRLGGGAPSAYTSGRIAEVAIWNAALTDAEVAALGTGRVSPLRVRRASLISYPPIWGIHSPEIDLANPSISWTVTGATRANHAPVVPYSARYWGTAPAVVAAAAGSVARQMQYYRRLRVG